MAEYIDRTQIYYDVDCSTCNGHSNPNCDCDKCLQKFIASKNQLDNIPIADVVERAEYDKVVQTFKARVDNQRENLILIRNAYFQIEQENAELRFKIDKVIEKIEFLRQYRAEYITEDSKICIDSGEVLKILRNIGE